MRCKLDKETAENLATYNRWKADILKKGQTPMDMVSFYRTIGQAEYADQIEEIIQKMEALSSSLP